MKKAILLTSVFFVMTLLNSGNALAFNVGGKYEYKEKGCEGEMVVTEVETGMNPHITAKIGTVCGSAYYTCDTGDEPVVGTRDITEGNSVSTSFTTTGAPSVKFDIVFTPKGATIENIDNGSSLCGAGGGFSGKWVKVKTGGKK